jgi:hypothetical protein
MVASALAQDLEEDLGSMEDSIGDLVGASEGTDMASKTWDFGPSSVTAEAIVEMLDDGFFKAGRAMPSLAGEIVPDPQEGYAVMFKDYFTCGLRLPSISFLRQVLEAFQLQIHHLTPNGFLMLSKFCWACESYGAIPNIDTFCAYYELQKQLKKVKVGGVKLVA